MRNLIEKPNVFAPLFAANGNELSLQPGAPQLPIVHPESFDPGTDYFLYQEGDSISTVPSPAGIVLGGFHVGLDGQIAPHSIWDTHFRPKCSDPRGMVLVAGKFWCDIYLLNDAPENNGTSKAGVPIARRINWFDSVARLAEHGKDLLSLAEFSVAASGVKEGVSLGTLPDNTGHAPNFKSKWGVEQATGCMWTWGRDVDHYDCRAIILGGGYWDDPVAGSRRFFYGTTDSWDVSVGARGRCDHLILS